MENNNYTKLLEKAKDFGLDETDVTKLLKHYEFAGKTMNEALSFAYTYIMGWENSKAEDIKEDIQSALFCDELVVLMRDNDIPYDDIGWSWYDKVYFIHLVGDWKKDHARLDELIRKNTSLIYDGQYITECNGNRYGASHCYKLEA